MTAEYDAYQNLLNSQPEDVGQFETLTISNPHFTKTYYLVFDNKPLTAKTTDGQTVIFEPANISATNAQNSNDLDQTASFSIEDLDNILDDELDNVPLGDTSPILAGYSIYTSNFLDKPAEHVVYNVVKIPQKEGAFTMVCGAPDLNSNETGEVFDFDRFPMLRGL